MREVETVALLVDVPVSLAGASVDYCNKVDLSQVCFRQPEAVCGHWGWDRFLKPIAPSFLSRCRPPGLGADGDTDVSDKILIDLNSQPGAIGNHEVTVNDGQALLEQGSGVA